MTVYNDARPSTDPRVYEEFVRLVTQTQGRAVVVLPTERAAGSASSLAESPTDRVADAATAKALGRDPKAAATLRDHAERSGVSPTVSGMMAQTQLSKPAEPEPSSQVNDLPANFPNSFGGGWFRPLSRALTADFDATKRFAAAIGIAKSLDPSLAPNRYSTALMECVRMLGQSPTTFYAKAVETLPASTHTDLAESSKALARPRDAGFG